MADDNNARYRTNDPFSGGPAPAAPASDPLAELARLIGQNDPFSEYGREARPAAAQADAGARLGSSPAASHVSPAPQYGSEPAPVRYSDPAPSRSSDPAPQYDTGPRYAADNPPRYNGDQAAQNDWPGSPSPSYPDSDPLALPPDRYLSQPAAQSYDSQGYASQGYASPSYPSQGYADPLGQRDGYQSDPAAFDTTGYPPAAERQGYSPLYPHEPEAGGMPAPHDDEFYDDEPRGGRRRGLLTVVAVLGLAVVGTAGAFGYRSLFGGPGSASPPPVIRASGEPSKVAPPPPTSADQAAPNKFSYDRFGDAGKDEQVVRREEKPVDLSKAPPRTVLPGAPVANSPSGRQANSGSAAGANPPSAIGEPRRVRTVPIRPEGEAAATAPAQQPTSVAPPRQANTAAIQPADARASSRVATRPAPAQQAPLANAPLSLSPDANNSLPPPAVQEPSPPPQAPPRASAPPSSRMASAPAAAPSSGGGNYLVQVSSQRSEADAENAYRGIQSKFSSVLGNQPHTVRRADLGAKGVYYRAMVGPFGSREEAVQICSSLKQAGGNCVVQQ